MNESTHKPSHFVCETCGKKTLRVRRDVLDADYDALGKTPLWNCEECYQKKHQARLDEPASDQSSS